MEVELHSIITSLLDGGKLPASQPTSLPLEKETQVPTEWKARWDCRAALDVLEKKELTCS
jgi:hypothetical protein